MGFGRMCLLGSNPKWAANRNKATTNTINVV
jgi:hypothetical protein